MPNQWLELIKTFSNDFEKRSIVHDENDTFVMENYNILKAHRFFSLTIPKELGGEGLSYPEMCEILRHLAHACSSTALAFSMHQHLVAANVWKYKRGQGGEAILKNVADHQLILVSTGAKDWLQSNGSLKRTYGGFLLSAEKHFASQTSVGNVLVTSAPYEDPEQGWQVLHFGVPFNSEGLTAMDNWYTLGMRATGSHTVKLNNVFIPDSAIVLKRPRGGFHPVFNVVLGVAMPYIMSVYVGIAEKAAQMAIDFAKKKDPRKDLIADMNNDLTAAQVQLQDMIRLTNNFEFDPIDRNGHQILTRKTNVANAAISTVTKAMKLVGGQSFFRSFGLERLFRDIQGAHHHPLPEKDQVLLSGEFLLDGKFS